MTPTEIRHQTEALLFDLWRALPEPKPSHPHWYYKDGGYYDLLEEDVPTEGGK